MLIYSASELEEVPFTRKTRKKRAAAEPSPTKNKNKKSKTENSGEDRGKPKKQPGKAKTTKGKRGGGAAQQPPPEEKKKKVGRPTNEERRAKSAAAAKEKYETAKVLREKQRQAATIAATATTEEDATTKLADLGEIPKYPVFLVGQRVEAIYDGITYKGTICYDHSVNSGMIRVNWDDGSSQYAAKQNLKVIPKKVLKNVFSLKETRAEIKAKMEAGAPPKKKRTKAVTKLVEEHTND